MEIRLLILHKKRDSKFDYSLVRAGRVTDGITVKLNTSNKCNKRLYFFFFYFSMLKATTTQGITVKNYTQQLVTSLLSATAKAVIGIGAWEPSDVTDRA